MELIISKPITGRLGTVGAWAGESKASCVSTGTTRTPKRDSADSAARPSTQSDSHHHHQSLITTSIHNLSTIIFNQLTSRTIHPT